MSAEFSRASLKIEWDSGAVVGDSALLTTGWHLETTFGAGVSAGSPGGGLGGWEKNGREEKSMKNGKRPNRARQTKSEKEVMANEKK